jgi:hypothetical protein
MTLRSLYTSLSILTGWLLLSFALPAAAQNPSGVFTPVQFNSDLPYKLELRQYSMGNIDVPTLHSYAVGENDGEFVFLSGRTNGLHGFDIIDSASNFPPQFQNRDVWVIDFKNRQSWRRPLDDPTSGLTEAQILSLSPTNNQFYRDGDTLYMTGGYGVFEDENFGTFDTLSAINLPGISEWVKTGAGSAAQHIRQIHNPVAQITGGAMYALNGRTHLVFGQDFQGTYNPFSEGTYTEQIRSFDIVDDGVNLSIANVTTTTPDENYRRRDLNVFPVLRPDGMGGTEQGLTVLSGVFTLTNGPWTVPVEIDAAGNPMMADPNDPNTFQQSMNHYHSAKLGLYSEVTGEMHELLFGGISLKFFDEASQTVMTDGQLPFVNDITSVVVDADGNYSQHHLGLFPEVFDLQNRRLRFGTNSEFLIAQDIPTFDNGVIQLDALHGETTVGYIFGGIVANAPHTRRNPGLLSAGSNFVFEVVLVTVPEPASFALLTFGAIMGIALLRRTRE